MERYVMSDLIYWVNNKRRKPLLIRGARQVGKSWLVDKLGKEKFEFYLKIDFEKNRDFISLFEGDLEPQKICSELGIRTGVEISAGSTLLFFDEIQACPRAIMALRYFYEKMPDLHVIAAGSLLEFALSDISFPVGRIQMLEIHPMNFSEFLLALGYKQAAQLVNTPVAPVSESTHEFLSEQLRIYWLVGGMPESVMVYAQDRMLLNAVNVQDEIINTYRMDFMKYKPKTDIECLNAVFSSTAAKVGQQIKYTGLANNFSIPTIRKAYESLLMARTAYKVKSLSSIGIPLEVGSSEKKFKNIFLDIGLMNRVMGVDYNEVFTHANLLSVYRGQLAEQYVGQEFVVAADQQLYYWSRDAKSSSAELDYVWISDHQIYPIEVKDGPSGKLRSLHLYRSTWHPSLSLVFHGGPSHVLKDEKIFFLPLYFAGAFAEHGLGDEFMNSI